MPDIHMEEVYKDFYIIRVDDDETKYFEAIWEIPEGMTYNAYLLFDNDKTVLFDTWKKITPISLLRN